MALILAVNAGSSSLKISLYRPTDNRDQPVDLVLTSSITNISSPPATFKFDGHKEEVPADEVKDHASAFACFLRRLKTLRGHDPTDIRHICHRVVHGGDFTTRLPVDRSAYHRIHGLSDLAPLHNGAALAVIEACLEKIQHAQSIAYFDSAFHRTIPSHIQAYAIDQTVAAKRGLKKYGFHGLSYAFILRSVASFLQRPQDTLNLIVLHLGSGASICAIRNGRSLDTSMGLTPLSGLPGATRSGDVDPSLIFHYTNKAGRMTHDPSLATDLRITAAEDILNRRSGWQSLAGTTDFGLICSRADPHAPPPSSPGPTTDPNAADPRCTLAFHLVVDRILDFVGAYHLKLGCAVDALVFSGGIGEKSALLRGVVGERVGCLGYVKVDEGRNERAGEEVERAVVVDIGVQAQGERAKRILVCQTDEQVEMARGCALDEEFRVKD
ncbi:putative acetate kinase [Lyophyllum shimeji]|uniref:Probable acetate kinase n=1 Tax=Lyophyllum shimeji TaxID=47721 RepID=A0A9P3PRF8_LYOSH|nr:putative acetate kinase [Lyophyllum shimeji]